MSPKQRGQFLVEHRKDKIDSDTMKLLLCLPLFREQIQKDTSKRNISFDDTLALHQKQYAIHRLYDFLNTEFHKRFLDRAYGSVLHFLLHHTKDFEKNVKIQTEKHKLRTHQFLYVMQHKSSSQILHQDFLKKHIILTAKERHGIEKIIKPIQNCAICFKKYQEKTFSYILPCKHEFHKACLDKWLNNKKTCPICRDDISIELKNAAALAQKLKEKKRRLLKKNYLNCILSLRILTNGSHDH